MINIYIVHSVKGGCGKTAYSLFKAVTTACDSVDKEKNKANVLYLDADFKGTSTKTLIYGKNEGTFETIKGDKNLENYKIGNTSIRPDIGFIFEKKYNPNTLNDFLKGKSYYIHDIIVHGGIFECEKMEMGTVIESEIPNGGILDAKIDFIFSSPDAKEKEMFRCHGNNNSNMLSIALCADRVKSLMEQIIVMNQYTDIIIDMPPGDDEYSDILIEKLQELKRNDKINLYLYMITTNDLGHLETAIDALQQCLLRRPNNPDYDQYCMVYNEFRQGEFKEDVLVQRNERFAKILNEAGMPNLDKLYYTVCKFREDYYQYCRERTDLSSFIFRIDKEKRLFS